ncbi:cyanophycinase [Pedobacter polaris]|uniref:Cyanophycinase n=1 Tax=Pedobacter polaris TaxID=2571273 RepID=A0A4U1CEL1_9SPHI|nr:cyanophycinase [Pedobacter polaris]TKC05496.1 cyanophycinase [Pedobacter polaris]
MKKSLLILLISCCISSISCGKSGDTATPVTPTPPVVVTPTPKRPGSIGIIGDSSNVVKPVTAGMVLMGGGADVEAAFKWMIDRSGGGDVVILRATGTDAYNPFVNGLGTVNSVETLLINSRELANDDIVAYIIRNAEMVFIAGGDQSHYMNYWRGTKVEKALNYLLTEKKAPVGGTSAGCAILGGLYYSGENGSVTSSNALQNPFENTITLYNNDFLKSPFLQNVITDQHYLTREREGRSMVFLGRILKDWNIAAKGIAVDERTAVCIDATGKAKVYGDYSATRPYSYAYFLMPDLAKKPEQLIANTKVTWNYTEQAVSVYEIPASVTGEGNFNVANFNITDATGGKSYWWSINNGVLIKKLQ